jgi:hypothetical protein
MVSSPTQFKSTTLRLIALKDFRFSRQFSANVDSVSFIFWMMVPCRCRLYLRRFGYPYCLHLYESNGEVPTDMLTLKFWLHLRGVLLYYSV